MGLIKSIPNLYILQRRIRYYEKVYTGMTGLVGHTPLLEPVRFNKATIWPPAFS